METATILATLASGGVIGLILGLVGGGGSILAVPLLVYVVGMGSPHAAIGTAGVGRSSPCRSRHEAIPCRRHRRAAARRRWRCRPMRSPAWLAMRAAGG
jgi:hypothetical protein